MEVKSNPVETQPTTGEEEQRMSEKAEKSESQHLLGWPRVMGLAFTHFYQHLVMTSLAPILTLIQADFGVGYTQMGFLLSAARFSGGVLQLPAGMAADRLGKKLVLLAGFGLLLSSVFFSGLAPTFLVLIVLQLSVGIADSVFHPATYSLISQGSRRDTLGISMSIHTMAGFAGTYLAMSLIARMGDAVGWRSTLMLLPIPGLILMGILAAWFKEPPSDPEAGDAEGDGDGSSLLEGPLPYIFLAGLMGGIGMQGLIGFLPTFLHVVHGLSVVEAGDLAGLMVVGVASMLVGGWLADRVNRINLVAGGAVSAAAMVALLALWTPPLALLPLLLMGTGVAIYLTTPAHSALISAYASGATQGRLYGVSFAGSALGSSVGAIMVGFIADLAGFQVAFIFLAGASLARAAIILSLRRFDVWVARRSLDT